MKDHLKKVLILFPILIVISVYYRWFFLPDIIGGDWLYLFKESLENYYFLVPSWNTWQGNGLGGTNPIYFLQSFEYLTVFIATFLHIPWPIIYKFFWFGFFIFSSVSSSMYLLSVVLPKTTLWQRLIAAMIFISNTYVLMLVGGGQMGVALAYSVAPLVLARFIKVIDHIIDSNKNFQFSIFNFQLALLAGLTLSLQALFDPRIAYTIMIAVTIYLLFKVRKNILNILLLIFHTFIIPGLITLLLHIFWILPLIVFSQNTCERFCEAYTGVGIVRFLSFSTFSQGLSLLHPNWPENIFGKVGFMKPEFILIPVLAFFSLLFLSNSAMKQFHNRVILFFALLGIVGAFLAKGANPPFGDFYLWLFENIPGFEMFRDPTKFYLLVALSYSVLIPFSIYSIYKWLSSKCKVQSAKLQFKIQNYSLSLILIFFIIHWVVLIHPAIFGQLGGTLKKHEVPKEYVMLKDFLHKQPEFFRTLWVPRQQRFTFLSNIHPSVEAGALFNATSSAQAIRGIKEKGYQYFSELAVKYVIVPYDSLGEFFLTDRKYDKIIPEKISKSLENVPWLKKINGFGNITIFEVLLPKNHFWLEKSGKISYKMVSPTQYIVNVSTIHGQKLTFSEKYNPSWVAKVGDKAIKSKKTLNNLNSFALEKGGYDLEVIFLQDKAYGYGRAISLVAFLGVLFFIFKYRKSSSLSN